MSATLWFDVHRNSFFVGEQEVTNLSPLQRSILETLLARPHVYLTKTEIIEASWPADVARNGVTDSALQRQISDLRTLLANYSQRPFIVTWRGIPEGGYRLINCAIPAEQQAR